MDEAVHRLRIRWSTQVEDPVEAEEEEDSRADTQEDLQEVQTPANSRWSFSPTELGEAQTETYKILWKAKLYNK